MKVQIEPLFIRSWDTMSDKLSEKPKGTKTMNGEPPKTLSCLTVPRCLFKSNYAEDCKLFGAGDPSPTIYSVKLYAHQ